MIDLRQARERPDELRAALARKGAADVLDELLTADAAVREVQPRVEELRAARKVKGKPTPEQLAELERVKQELQQLEEQLAAAEARRKQLLERVPNPADEGAPDWVTDEAAGRRDAGGVHRRGRGRLPPCRRAAVIRFPGARPPGTGGGARLDRSRT